VVVALHQVDDVFGADHSVGWITAQRARRVTRLAREDGPLQMSLFDQQDLGRDRSTPN
jgi:hypothetical protein